METTSRTRKANLKSSFVSCRSRELSSLHCSSNNRSDPVRGRSMRRLGVWRYCESQSFKTSLRAVLDRGEKLARNAGFSKQHETANDNVIERLSRFRHSGAPRLVSHSVLFTSSAISRALSFILDAIRSVFIEAHHFGPKDGRNR